MFRIGPDKNRGDPAAESRFQGNSIPFQIHYLPFYSILLYYIPFHSILFHSVPFHSISFHSILSILFQSIQFNSTSIPLYYIPFHSIIFHSILLPNIVGALCTVYVLCIEIYIVMQRRLVTVPFILYIYSTSCAESAQQGTEECKGGHVYLAVRSIPPPS